MARRAVAPSSRAGSRSFEITMTVPGAVGVIQGTQCRDRSRSHHRRGHRAGSANRPRLHRGWGPVHRPARAQPRNDCPMRTTRCRGDAWRADPDRGGDCLVAGARFRQGVPRGRRGGAKLPQGLEGTLPHIRLVPTGGVSLETAAASSRPGPRHWAWWRPGRRQGLARRTRRGGHRSARASSWRSSSRHAQRSEGIHLGLRPPPRTQRGEERTQSSLKATRGLHGRPVPATGSGHRPPVPSTAAVTLAADQPTNLRQAVLRPGHVTGAAKGCGGAPVTSTAYQSGLGSGTQTMLAETSPISVSIHLRRGQDRSGIAHRW